MVVENTISHSSALYSSSPSVTLVSQGGGIGGGAYVVGVMKALKEIGILLYVTKTYTSSAAVPAQ